MRIPSALSLLVVLLAACSLATPLQQASCGCEIAEPAEPREPSEPAEPAVDPGTIEASGRIIASGSDVDAMLLLATEVETYELVGDHAAELWELQYHFVTIRGRLVARGDIRPPRLEVEAYTVVALPQDDDPEPHPEPGKPGTPQGPGQPQATCGSGLPFVRLVRLEPATSVAEGEILRAWVSIDQDPQQRIYGGVIISDSATGNHWHAFAFYPGEREKSAAFYTVEPGGDDDTVRTITVWVNPAFRDTYCTADTMITIEVFRE